MDNIDSLYRSLLLETEDLGTQDGLNLVAFSGGVDSSLVAAAVRQVFPENSEAIMALSPSVSQAMKEMAEEIAADIGIPLRFVATADVEDPAYVANEGMSCYICKNNIYHAMEAVYTEAERHGSTIAIFNGTNAEDIKDLTRVGLRAAREHRVRSPLSRFTKDEVRQMSRHAGLRNWHIAATPCLRSRIHVGVPATEDHLRRIEAAEEMVRGMFALDDTVNFRVRHLPNDLAMLEIDGELLPRIELDRCSEQLLALGFSAVNKRAFRSGSVSVEAERILRV